MTDNVDTNGDSNLDEETGAAASSEESPNEKKGTRRAIPGNLPYVGTYKRLGDAVRGLIEAERPPKFNEDYLGAVLKISGGSARSIPPILKRVGLLNPDNSPTDLYSKFKSESSRPQAALRALRNGFAEVFKRSQYAHKENDEKIKDIIVEITGLKRSDPIIGSMLGTFNVFREYAKTAIGDDSSDDSQSGNFSDNLAFAPKERQTNDQAAGFNLVNTINIVLPETTDVQVYNAIFRSIRENLM